MLKKLFFVSVLLVQTFLYAQPKRNCATMDVLDRLIQSDPVLKESMVTAKKNIKAAVEKRALRLNKIQSERIIPVVVHIVYNSAVENISKEQILSQIEVLNQDFQKMEDTPGFNSHPLGANAHIQFRLATIDPAGNPNTGITRKRTNKRSFDIDDAVKNSNQGGTNPWPADKYLNIWVCKLTDDMMGYAQLPGGPARTDGVVIDYRNFGIVGTATEPYDLGRTTTHEVGHYLALYHIWGDGGCRVDDEISDTPKSDAPNYECPHGHQSCGSLDMIENYMDYTDDACMNIFTVGQSERMNAVLDGIRSDLVSWHPWGASIPVANANGPYSGDSDSAIQFSSENSYDPDGIIESYLWNFGDGNSSTQYHPVHTYSSAGTYTVTLTVTDNDGLSAIDETIANIQMIENESPVANANGPYSGVEGSVVQFTSDGSYDPDGNIESYLWNFGDGNASALQNPVHTYSTAGTYTVILKVTNNDRLDVIDETIAIIQSIENESPVANANGPYSGVEGSVVQFSSEGSYDPDGNIASYLWNFGDGNASAFQNPVHTYSSAGTYTVTLTVTDNDGEKAVDNTNSNITEPDDRIPEVIYSEGFEYIGSEVPGMNWQAWDTNRLKGKDYWGDQHRSWGAKVHYGRWSLYCSEWSNLSGIIYDHHMNSYVKKRSAINISGYSNVEISFWLWYKTAGSDDFITFEFKNSSGKWIEVKRWYGLNGNRWKEQSFIIEGITQFNFRFRFQSNSQNNTRGAYIDDIVVSGIKSYNLLSDRSDRTIEEKVICNIPIRCFDLDNLNTGIRKDESEFDQLFTEEMNNKFEMINYPTPFNSNTVIRYYLPYDCYTKVTIYNTLGVMIDEFENRIMEAGFHEIMWRPDYLPSGIYFYVLDARGLENEEGVNIVNKTFLFK
jgi:PKD repeat protein